MLMSGRSLLEFTARGGMYVVTLTTTVLAQALPFPTLVDVPVKAGTAGTGWAAVGVDGQGNRYVTEQWRNWVRRITPTGEITPIAGQPGESGSQDGKGSDARFGVPYSFLTLALDSRGNIFVPDTFNHVIRKVTADGDVSTIAGQPGEAGTADGIGRAARFSTPIGIAVDTSGTLYIADDNGVRTMNDEGVVSTLARTSGTLPGVTSPDADARFSSPAGITVDRDRNVYLVCYDNTVRKITQTGQVTVLAGRASQRGFVDGNGRDARFEFSANFNFDDMIPVGIAVDPAGNVWVADPGNRVIRRITADRIVTSYGQAARMIRPTGVAVDAGGGLHVVDVGMVNRLLSAVAESRFLLHAVPSAQIVARGSTAVFTVSASGTGLTYQWKKDGTLLAEAVQPTLVIKAAGDEDSGNYGWTVRNARGVSSSGEVTLAVDASQGSSRIVNVSVLSETVSAATTLMVGTTIAGRSSLGTMPVLLRAVGPSLGRFDRRGFLEDPALTLRRGDWVVGSNDDWGGDASIVRRAADVGAFPFDAASSRDAAIATSLVPGSYVMEIAGRGEGMGATLGEWFDATPEAERSASAPRIMNLSARKELSRKGEILSAGFVIGGPSARTVLLRAVGPSLATLGVAGSLPDPMLQLFAGSTLAGENHDWGGDDQLTELTGAVNAFAFGSVYSKDAALLITLQPGEYTLQVRSESDDAGVVLAEIYDVP